MKSFAACLLCLVFASAGWAETPWKFIVTGDTRSDGEDNGVNITILSELADEIVNQNADFVLVPGDLVTGGVNQTALESQFNTWRDTMQPVYDANIGVYVVRGGHDVGSPAGVTAWNNVFPDLPDNGPSGEVNLTYSARHKNTLIIALDQFITSHRVNQTWLNSQFSANTSPHIFVFGHEPAFKVNHSDCLHNYPANRDAFWFSIKNAGGRTYFCGHDHFYNHARVDNDGEPNNDVHQYVVGTGGAPIYSWSGDYDGVNDYYTLTNIKHVEQYGYVICEVNGLKITLTWMERTGEGVYTAGEIWNYTATLTNDLNNDGAIDFRDFAVFAEHWLEGVQILEGDFVPPGGVGFEDIEFFAKRWLGTDCGSSNNCDGTDLNLSGKVDFLDFAVLAGNWLKTK
jgi:hypothetical protein